MVTITVAGKTITVSDAAHWRTVREQIDSLYTALAALGGEGVKAVALLPQRSKADVAAKSGTIREYAAMVLTRLPDGLSATNLARAMLDEGWTTRATTLASKSAWWVVN